jgi:hypothetical protein
MINYISFILIICILFYIYTQTSSSEHFKLKDDFVVYIVWNDLINPYGLGDRLRGSIAIYQYCDAYNIKCVFDPRFSAFGKFFESSKSNDLDLRVNSKTPVYQILTSGGSNSIKMFLNNKMDEQEINSLVENTVFEVNNSQTLKDYMDKIMDTFVFLVI